MTSQHTNPELCINYSPRFSLTLRLAKAERVGSGGYTSWQFEFRCVVRHSKGQFTYDVTDLYLDLGAFEQFSEQLNQIREGRGQSATLSDEGQMVTFCLFLDGHQLKSTIKIREYQPDDELTILSAGFRVDYDLFVNKLHEELNQLIKRLRSVTPKVVPTV